MTAESFRAENRYERFLVDSQTISKRTTYDTVTFKEFQDVKAQVIEAATQQQGLEVLIGFPGIGNIGPELIQLLSTIGRAHKLCSIRSIYHEPRVSVVPFAVPKKTTRKPTTMAIRAVAPRDYLFFLPAKDEQPALLLFSGINPMNDIGLQSYTRELMDYLEQFELRQITVINGLSLDTETRRSLLGARRKGIVIGTTRAYENTGAAVPHLETTKWIINAIYGGGAVLAEADFRDLSARSLLVATDSKINSTFPIDTIAVEAAFEMVQEMFHLDKEETAEIAQFVGKMAESLRTTIKQTVKEQKREQKTEEDGKMQTEVPVHALDFIKDRTII